MSLTVSFELDEEDLKHFRDAMAQAGEAAEKAGPEAVVEAGRGLLSKVREQQLPRFISDRLDRLEALIAMIEDVEWAIQPPERGHVLSALAYFSDPQDMIPDAVPGFGFLDDAIMIELVMSELRPEIDAYEDFCRFRERPSQGGAGNREDYLATKRAELHSRMRRRESRSGARSSSGMRFSLW